MKGLREEGKQRWGEEDLNEDRPHLAALRRGRELQLTGASERAVAAGRQPRPEGPGCAPARAPRNRREHPPANGRRASNHRESFATAGAGLHAQGGVLGAAIFSSPGCSRSRFSGPSPRCPRRSQRSSRRPGKTSRPAGHGTALAAPPFTRARLVLFLTEGGAGRGAASCADGQRLHPTRQRRRRTGGGGGANRGWRWWMCASEAGAAPLSLPYAAGPAAGAGTRSPRRRAAGTGEQGRGVGEGHRPVKALPGPVEPPMDSARRRGVTQRCETACVPCRGASTGEGCRGHRAFVGLAVERGKHCIEDSGVWPLRLLLRGLRWPLSPLPRVDSSRFAAPAGALQGQGRGGPGRLPAPAPGNCAQGEFL